MKLLGHLNIFKSWGYAKFHPKLPLHVSAPSSFAFLASKLICTASIIYIASFELKLGHNGHLSE
jgi:hypothetical protein